MKKPRITHVISELDIGGAERQLALILPSLQEHFDNHVICIMGHGSVGEELERSSIPVHYLGDTSMLNPATPLRLWRTLRTLQPDASIGYLLYADVLNRVMGKLAGIRTIISSQRSSLVGRGYLRMFDWLTKGYVNAYTAQTMHAKEQLHGSIGVPLQNIHVIPNAVASPKAASTIDPLQHIAPQDSRYVITCVSNLKAGKGHTDLIAAFSEIQHRNTNVHLVLVGEGPLRAPLVHHVEELGMQTAVHFLGTREDVQDILAVSDSFVLPTYGEGMSNALLEAMAAGLACITSDIPANTEVIEHKKHGLLYRTGNKQELAKCIRELLDNPNTRHTLGRAAKERIQQNHSLPAVTDQWTQVLQKLLDIPTPK